MADPAAPTAPPLMIWARQVRAGWAAPAVAALAAVVVTVSGWRGVDLAAHIYAVDLFRRNGFALWDGQWFGGHWTLGYTVLYSPVAATLGLHLTAVASAVAAAWAFDRLVVEHFGTRARAGALAFALGTLAQVAIGQLPYLLGEALGLAALLAASRRRWALAAGLTVLAALSSPLAGGFVALAAAAWLLSAWPRHRGGLSLVLGAALVPVLVLQVLFPQGVMPYTGVDFAIEVVVFAALAALIPHEERALRIGAILYVGAIVASFVMPTAMGGNVLRLGGCAALPLAICIRSGRLRRQLATLLLLPILVITWAPVWASATTGRTASSAQPGYYAPVLGYLRHHRTPVGRVEVVPTALHWETVFVAPTVPLARGWERQLDLTDNPIFYRQGPLSASAYLAWLRDNGVRYVALSDAALDYSGRAESRLLARPRPGLPLVWHDAHWRLFQVQGSSGIVAGPAQLVRITRDEVDLRALRGGSIAVHVRPANRWVVSSGRACLRSSNGATVVQARAPGTIVLRIRALPPTDAQSDAGGC